MKSEELKEQLAVAAVALSLAKHQMNLFVKYEQAVANLEESGFSHDKAVKIVDQAMNMNAEGIRDGFKDLGIDKKVREHAAKARAEVDKLFGI